MVSTFISALMALTVFSASGTVPEPVDIVWSDLIPKNTTNTPKSSAPIDHDAPAEQSGSEATVTALDGKLIRMPGFMLPLDYTEKGKVSAFLLVPYYGACIHVPPPPPNQIVFVDTSDNPVASRGLWDPVTVTGTLKTKSNENGLGDAAYTLKLTIIGPYKG